MAIAVITPVYRPNRAWLDQCLASVRAQTIPCTHFLVNDGDETLVAADYPGVEFVSLPKPHEDTGNAARAVGSVSAIARGCDAIAYLDADNWFEPDHLQQMVALHRRTGAAVCTAGRLLIALEGQVLGRCPEVDGDRFADTNTLFLTRAAFEVVSVWYLMPKNFAAVGDRVVWKAILEKKLTRAHSQKPTVHYRTNYRAHYEYFGKAPPAGAKRLRAISDTAGRLIEIPSFDCPRAELREPDASSEAEPRRTGTSSPSLGASGSHAAITHATIANVIVNEAAASPSGSEPPSVRARVSLCMIVKNEEANLADCLASVADLVHEMIVVDTGSTDRTKEVAGRFGAKVYDFAWQDNFAAARNESLRHATGDWIFWLDGDDCLDETNRLKLRGLFATLPDDNLAFMMCQRSAPDQMTGTTLIVDQTRLFRNLPQARWTGRIHEQILRPLQEQGARLVGTDIAIDHFGYQTPEARARKLERNLRLLHLEVRDNPHDPFALFNLANSLLDAGQPEKAFRFIHRCLEHAPADAIYMAKAYCILVDACRLLGREDEALQHCREGKARFPMAAELWYREGALYSAKGSFSQAQQTFEELIALPPDGITIGADAELRSCRTRDQLAYVYRRLGLLDKAEEQWRIAVEESPRFEKAWLALLEIYLETNRQPEAQALLQRLEGKEYRDAIWPSLQARMKVAQGDIAGAQEVLESAIARKPNVLWPRLVLSDILLRLGHDKQVAEGHLRAILELAPNETQTRARLNQLLASGSRG